MLNEVTSDIRGFILGGRAEFTVVQEKFKYEYQVKANDNHTCWFVSVKVGTDWIYQGYLKKDYTFYRGKKGSESTLTNQIKGLQWILVHGDNLPSVVHIIHHGKCSVCGRKLTDVESLSWGIGPSCRKKIGVC